MVVPPPLADLRHPADRWQTVFASTMPLAEKSEQNADGCDIQATVSLQAVEFPPIGRGFFATPRDKKSGDPTFWYPAGTGIGAVTPQPTSGNASPLSTAHNSTCGEILHLRGQRRTICRCAGRTELRDQPERQG
jgi:hypothetical protein